MMQYFIKVVLLCLHACLPQNVHLVSIPTNTTQQVVRYSVCLSSLKLMRVTGMQRKATVTHHCNNHTCIVLSLTHHLSLVEIVGMAGKAIKLG